MKNTCLFDLIAVDGATLEEVGTHYYLTRERIRQLEFRAKRNFRQRTKLLGVQIHLEQMPAKYFVDKVIDMRVVRGWTNKVLAGKAGLPNVAIIKIMDGQVVLPSVIEALAKAFEVPVGELVSGTEFDPLLQRA